MVASLIVGKLHVGFFPTLRGDFVSMRSSLGRSKIRERLARGDQFLRQILEYGRVLEA